MPHLTRHRDCLVRAIVRAFHGLPLLTTLGCLPLFLGDALAQSARLTVAQLLTAAPQEIERLLEEARPAPLSVEIRQRVLATLPRDGEVTQLDPRRARKVGTVGNLLAATRRTDTHLLKIVDVKQAAVALHARSIVLITLPALDLLSEDELTALVAHELGHEYTWSDWVDATERGDRHRLRDIELICDLIAVVTLNRLGKPSSVLVDAIDKISQRNLDSGHAGNVDNYPSMSQRRKAIREMGGQLARR